jgi:hypothetical protein
LKQNYFLIFLTAILLICTSAFTSSWDLTDAKFKFSITMPDEWKKTDSKQTDDSDAISYSFERKDKKCSMMILAFRLTAVKNLEDFIYTMEKDISLNIPSRTGDYITSDNGDFDSKAATYKDQQFLEKIWYFRTKMPDAPYNYVYMLRCITSNEIYNSDIENQFNKISGSFLPEMK